MDKAIEIRSKCRHFRVLVIGKANAGKTTLLKKVCNSIEDPEIFSPSGEKLDPAVVQGSSERGLHDVNNQLIFKSNPDFIFHDTRGFESGSLDEIRTVKSFISKCARSRELPEQLHVIWYCLPTDTNRPIFDADRKFFEEYGNGKVPLIAILTKFDGLVTMAFNELRLKEKLKDAKTKKVEKAHEKLKTNFIDPLMQVASRPSDYVQLDDMRKKESSCTELIEKTANALDDDTLKLLFISVQQNNVNICIHNAILRFKELLAGGRRSVDPETLIQETLAWFPHVWVSRVVVLSIRTLC